MKTLQLLLGASTLLFSASLHASLRITEICPRPDDPDPNGKEAGWIELTNTSETESVNLKDYALIRWNRGKEDKKKNRRVLCDRELGPGERTLVYTSEAYPNYWDGEKVAVYDNDVMVFPSKVNPKKFPNVALYRVDADGKDDVNTGKVDEKDKPIYVKATKVETFIVPVDLPDDQSFGPGDATVTHVLIDENTPYAYQIDNGEKQEGKGRLTLSTMTPPTNLTGLTGFTPILHEAISSVTDVNATTDANGLFQMQAFDFAKVANGNQGVQITPSSRSENTYAVSFWFRTTPDETSDKEGIPLFECRPSKTTDRQGIIVFINNDHQIAIQPRSSNSETTLLDTDTEADYADNKWHHVVLTGGQQKGDTLTLYVDGVAHIQTKLGFNCTLQQTIPYCFGHAYDSTSWKTFKGQIADIRIFNNTLNAKDVTHLADENIASRNVTSQYGGLTTKTNEATKTLLTYNTDTDTYTFAAGNYGANKACIENANQSIDSLCTVGETISLWIKPTSFEAPGKEAVVLMDARPASPENAKNTGYLLLYGTDDTKDIYQKIYVQRGSNTPVNHIFDTPALSTTEWTHLVLSIDNISKTMKLYHNGALVDTKEMPSYQPSTTTRRFGGTHDTANEGNGWWRGFRGEMSEINIFAGILPSREVVKCYNASAASRGKAVKTENGLEGSIAVETLTTVTGSASFNLSDYAGDATILFRAPETLGTLTLSANETPVQVNTPFVVPKGTETLDVAWTLEPVDGATATSVLITAELAAKIAGETRVIFPNMTPGEANDYITAIPYGPNIGPSNQTVFEDFGYYLPEATATLGENYTVVLDVHPIANDDQNKIAKVELMYRCAFGETKYVEMTYSNGIFHRVLEEEDKDTGEEIEVDYYEPAYKGVIPAKDLPAAGQLIQFGARITDGAGRQWISPSRNNPDDCPNWYGTIVTPDAETQMAKHEKLQTFHLFVEGSENLALMDKDYDAIKAVNPLGARVGIYDSQTDTYYDNVRIDLRGNTSAGFLKKSHGLRFSKCQPLTCKNMLEGKKGTKLKEIRKTSFTAEYADPTFIRQSLSFHMWRNAGNKVPFHYPVRLNLNGEFYQLAFHSNRFTDELIEDYYGLDPMGYGYKNVGTISANVGTTAGSVEKKTPDDGDETSKAAYAPMVAWAEKFQNSKTFIEQGGDNDPTLTNVVYDTFDIPAWINYLAMARITQECDDIWANICLYWDKNGNDVWMPLAYDHNLSFGAWYYGDDRDTGRIGLRPASDEFKSHPFYSGWKVRAHAKSGATVGSGNYAVEALWQNPEFRQMYLRRLRSLMDEHLKAPGTTQDETPFWDYVKLFKEVVAADAELDRAKWGTSYKDTPIYVWDHILGWDEAFTDLWDKYVAPRRKHLYETHAATNTTWEIGYAADKNAGIPEAHPAAFAPILMEKIEGGIKLTNPNTDSIDLSGWTVEGLMDVDTLPEDSEDVFTLPPGTVLLGGKSLVLAYNRKEYVKNNDPCFVIGLAVYGDDKTWIPEPNPETTTITLKKADGEVAVDNVLPAEIATWLNDAISAGTVTAADLATVTAAADYTMAYTLDTKPVEGLAAETQLIITAFSIDDAGDVTLTATIQMGDTVKDGTIKGQIQLLAKETLDGEWEAADTQTSFTDGKMPLKPSGVTAPRFFKARLKTPFEN